MNLNMTNYIFQTKVLNSLDAIYYEKLNFNLNKVFSYANLLNIYSNYDNYNIDKKLLTKTKDLVYSMIKYIKNNYYNENNSLILYSIVSSIVLNKYLKDYDITNNYDLDYAYSLHSSYNLDNFNMVTFFDKSFIFDFYDLEFLRYNINKVYFFPYADKILLKSIKKYKRKINKKNIFNKLYKYNKDINIDLTLFNELLENALHETNLFINAINDYLYLNKEKPLINFFNEYNY